MSTKKHEYSPAQTRQQIRKQYSDLVTLHDFGFESSSSCACTESDKAYPAPYLQGAVMGLGCGNPCLYAKLQAGEHVLDLGSGAGYDCFVAASYVGEHGSVTGIDMTASMVEKARQHALQAKLPHVYFHLGEIESMPIPDASMDVIISNCVINLSPEKEKVIAECYRVLKIGGRLVFADILRDEADETGATPFRWNAHPATSLNTQAYCLLGAITPKKFETHLASAGFTDINICIQDRENNSACASLSLPLSPSVSQTLSQSLPQSLVKKHFHAALISARKEN